jgi:mannan endo-1,4-beta-mannosidase
VPYFQDLKSKGVEVLFRPLHEMNQHNFWWSMPGPNGTAKLFALTRDYLINTKGLTNIGFVWDVQDIHVNGTTGGSDFANYNPGAGNFDVAALDVYGSGYTDPAYYNALIAQSFGRPVVIGETWTVPTPTVQQLLPQMAYFMIWAYGVYPPGTHPPAPGISVGDLQSLYSEPRVVTLSSMPGWK